MSHSIRAFALASTFALPLLAGCALAPTDSNANESASTSEEALFFPTVCIGQISGTPLYRDSGFVAGKDGQNIATVRASLPACAFRTWTSLWVQPTVTTYGGQPVTHAMDMVRLTSGQPIEATVDGLAPTTVYTISLNLFTIANNQFVQVGTTPNYFTITDGTDDGARARSAIVLHGLKQWDDQQKGLVGKNGVQPDGTRYTASPGEEWCTEFYAWVTSSRLTTTPYVQSYVGAMQAYFAFIGPDTWDTNKNAIKSGHPGDYMSMGNGQHSTMFLAYDPITDWVWTLEGNVGDDVAFEWHPRTAMDGIGKITTRMLR